jgi:putative zinc finger protein
VSCTELERLFLAGATPEEARRHANDCATCRPIGADVDAARGMVVGLVGPLLPASLRSALYEIPRNTVSCEGAEKLLPAAMENEISDDEQRRLSNHLSRCAACSEAAATLNAMRDLTEPVAPPWLAARIAANRPVRPKSFWRMLLAPKAAIALAYAAAVVVMLLGFNPADIARRVSASQLGENTRAAVNVAESSLTDRIGAIQERVARTIQVWKGRAGGYGRAALSNAVALIWKSSGSKERPVERPRNRDGRGTFREIETTITTWRA